MLKTAMKEKDGITLQFSYDYDVKNAKFSDQFPVATLVKSVIENKSGCRWGISVTPFVNKEIVGFFVHFDRISYTMFSASFYIEDKNPLNFLDNFLENIVNPNFDRVLNSNIVDYEVSLGYDDDDNNPEVKRNWK